MKVETEKKYYCMEPERLIRKALNLGFNLVDRVVESDEYFTDIDSEFVRNRTCLRIRKTNNSFLEITFKGKSNNLLGVYCKIENSIKAGIDDYDNYLRLFASLGYYSYVTVDKERCVYEFANKNYICHIMIDKLTSIGGFVEFEIISNSSQFKHDELMELLNKFVERFEGFNLKEADKPYRDIVSDYVFKKITNSSKISDLYVNLDEELKKYEKDFYKKYKGEIERLVGFPVKWRQYKLDTKLDMMIEPLIIDYLNNLVIFNSELLVTMKLLSEFNFNKHIVTEVNKMFFLKLLNYIGLSDIDIIFLDGDKNKFLNKKRFGNKNIVILNSKDVRMINSELLIIVNNMNA